MSDDVAVGTKVEVWDVDHKLLGFGTYQGEIDFDDDDNEIPFVESDDNPFCTIKILLDSDKVIYGFDCWWHEVVTN